MSRKANAGILGAVAVGFALLLAVVSLNLDYTGFAAYGGDGSTDCGKSVNETSELEGDITDCPGVGLHINASDITLRCQGYSITHDSNPPPPSHFGINVSGFNNVTIKDCNIVGFYSGIYLSSTYNISLRNNNVTNNYHGGIVLKFANNTHITGGRFYNNSPDFIVDNTGESPFFFNMSHSVFDSPSGLLENYTELSIDDSILANRAYAVSWSNASGPLPEDHISFENKYVEIRLYDFSDPVSIDSVTWHWSEGGTPSYNPSKFELWAFEEDSWKLKNNSPGEGHIGLSNFNPQSIYGILQNNNLTCNSIVTSSATMDEDLINCTGVGLHINASDITLDCAGYWIRFNESLSPMLYQDIGINVSNKENITIKNCNVEGFSQGLYFRHTHNFTIINNTVFNSSDYGFDLFQSSNNSFINNSAHSSSQTTGFNFFDNCNNNIILNNSASGANGAGFDVADSANNTLYNNTAFSNSQGFHFLDAYNLKMDNNIAYNNTNDVRFYGFDSFGFNMTDMYFLNPAGSFDNYTRLSIEDFVGSSTQYYINWSANSSGLPYLRSSFANKFVDIVNYSGSVSIDSINWSWDESELSGYDESRFELWKYNSTNEWELLNDSPDTTNNVLGLSSLNPASTYGILQRSLLDCGDLVNENTVLEANLTNCSDVGLHINTSDVTLDCAGYHILFNKSLSPGSSDYAINVTGFDNVTVNNCNVKGFNYGFYLDSADNATLVNNTANNNTIGFQFSSSSRESVLINNSAVLNTQKGFYIAGYSHSASLINNSAFGNGRGIEIHDSVADLNGNKLYDNSYDLYVNFETIGQVFKMTNAFFLNPSGTLENYTVLDIYDSLNIGDEYFINWSVNSSALPANRESFANKFVDIVNTTGSISINKINWSWDESELSGYDESLFELWVYNSTNQWELLNDSPDTTNNVLGLSSLNPASTYGILQETLFVNLTVNITSPANNSVFNISDEFKVYANITNNGTGNATGCNASLSITNESVINITSTETFLHTLGNITAGNSTVETWNLTAELIGKVNITVNLSCDTNSSYDAVHNISVQDVSAPFLTVQEPVNDSWYGSDVMDLNFTVSDVYLDSCWFVNVTGQNETLMNCQNVSFTALEGNNNVTVYANDTSNNVNSSQVFFYVDSVSPVITVSSPVNNTNYTYTNIDLNFTVSDVSLDSCWFTNVTGQDIALSGCANVTFTALQGDNNVTVYANDSADNVNSSQVFFFVDSLPPIFDNANILPPADSEFNQTDTVRLQVNVSESSDVTANITWNSNSEIVNLSYNGTDWFYNSTFNNTFFVGLYNVTFNATDVFGNGNVSYTNFTVNDVTAPLVVNVTPEVGSNYTNGTAVDITANATDPFYNNLDVVQVNVTWAMGSFQGVMDNDSEIYNYTFTNTAGYLGVYNVTIIANDTSGNVNDTETTWFNITRINAAPVVILNKPDNNAQVNNTNNVTLNFTVTDEFNLTLICGLYVNGNLNQTNTSVQNNTITNFYVNVTLGGYNWSVNCSDGDLSNASGTRNFTVNDTVAPALAVQEPVNDSWYGSDVMDLNFTVSDVYLDSCWFVNVTGQNETLMNCQNVSFTALEGNNNVTVYANDTSNNVNSSQVFFYVDSVSPVITVSSPVNNTNYTYTNIDLNFTVSDVSLDSCWFTNVTGQDIALSGCANVTFTALQGDNNVTVYANDSADNVNSSQVFFFVDSIPPGVENVTNVSVTNETANISFDITENANGTVDYGTTLALGSSAFNQSFSTPLVVNLGGLLNNTLYYYNVTSCDVYGNCNESGVYDFTTLQNPDTTPPKVLSIIPSPGSQFNQTDIVTISVNLSEQSNVTATISWRSASMELNLPYNGTDWWYNNTFGNTTQPGLYNVTINMTDQVGNSNITSANFTVNDLTAPAVTIISPDKDEYDKDEKVLFSVNVTDAYYDSVDTVSANISLPNGSAISLSLVEDGNTQVFNNTFNNTKSAGLYNFTVLANDTSRNINVSSGNFTVLEEEKLPPPSPVSRKKGVSVNLPPLIGSFEKNRTNVTADVEEVEVERITELPYTPLEVNLSLNETYKFRIEGEIHNVAIRDVSLSSAVFEFRSEPVSKEVFVNTAEEFDINNDSVNEVSVTLKEITGNNVTFDINRIAPTPPPAAEPEGEPVEEMPAEGLTLQKILPPAFLAGLLVVLIVLAVRHHKAQAVYKKPEERQREKLVEEIEEYVKEAESEGFADEKIRQRLLEEGWPENLVNEAFRKSK